MTPAGDAFWDAWAKVPDERRFRYRLNGRLVGFLLASQLVVWGYFTYTVVNVGGLWKSLVAFPFVYGGLLLLLLYSLARWRAFCVMSGVIVDDEGIWWRERARDVRLPWSTLDPQGLKLRQGTQPTDLSSHIELGLTDGRMERLIVTTPFAWLENLEGLLGQVLSRLGGEGDGAPSRRPAAKNPKGRDGEAGPARRGR